MIAPPRGEAKPELLRAALDLLARERGDEARLRELPELAGSCGVVNLSPAGDCWLFCWPSAAWPLWLHSPQRLPAHASIAGRSARARAWSMGAAPGDVLLASTAPLGDEAPLRRAAEEGGPSAVDRVAAASAGAEAPLCGLVAEVHG